jgi:hypothetical protein
LNNKITEVETNINNKIQNNEKTINKKLKDMEENINNKIDQMTAIIQQDIIVENQVKSQKDFEKTNHLIQEQNSVVIQQMQQLFQMFSSEMNMMKNDIRDVTVSLTQLNNKTEHQHHSANSTNNASNGGTPPPPPPGDSSSNSSEEPKNNPSPIPKIDNRDINKMLPPVKDWPKFSGAGEYDHITFINFIDHIVTSYQTTDEIVLVRLPRLFEGVALDWLITKKAAIGLKDWTTWKKLIYAQFGTRIWHKKIRKAFDTDHFDPTKHTAHDWCLVQKKRLECIYKNLTQEDINEKILDKCRGQLEHAVRCRMVDLDNDLNHLVATIEELVEMTGMNRKFREKGPNNNPAEEAVKDKKEEYVRKAPIPECHNCREKGHKRPDFPHPRRNINNITAESEEVSTNNNDLTDSEVEDTGSQFEVIQTNGIMVIQADIGNEIEINTIQGESNLPLRWDSAMKVGHISDAKLMTNKPAQGMNYTLGKTSYTFVLFQGKESKFLLDIGAFCSCTSSNFLEEYYPNRKHHLFPVPKDKFSSCSTTMKPIGIIPMPLVFPHIKGSIRLLVEFVLFEDAICNYLILGNDTFCMYGIEIFQSKERCYTIGGDWKKKFHICNINSTIEDKGYTSDLRKQELLAFDKEYFKKAAVSDILSYSQKQEVLQICCEYKEAFCTTDEPIGNMKGHDMKLELTVQRPYPPLLRRPPYPSSPKSREALETHIKELLELNVICKVGHNEQVEITTPVMIAWHNDKSRMVGDFRALNNYTKPDYYPIPWIDHSLHNLSKAKYINTMDVLKGFHQIPIDPDSRQYLRIICHLGIYEYLRMPFGIKNAPSHFQIMMDSIFGSYIRQNWMMIYTDDIIIYSDEWETHKEKIALVLEKAAKEGLKMSMKKCNFGYGELKALGHIVSGLTLAVDQNKVAAVLKKDMPQNRKEIMSFLGFCSYYRSHIPKFANFSKNLYGLCNNDTLFEMTYDRVMNFEELQPQS